MFSPNKVIFWGLEGLKHHIFLFLKAIVQSYYISDPTVNTIETKGREKLYLTELKT
jgi:hypothetical protein